MKAFGRVVRTGLWVVGVAATVLAAGALHAAPSGAESISYLTEDYPPSNYVENGELKGYAVELLKLVWRTMGVVEQKIEVTNWARAFNQLETTPNSMLFAMTRNAEREQKFQWVGPIFENRYVLIGRTERKLSLAGPADAANYRVGVIRQDVGHKLMLEFGAKDEALEKVADLRQLVKMLKANRIDLICASATILPAFASYGDFKAADLAVVATVKSAPLYYAFSKEVDSALVAAFQRALKGLNKERLQLLKTAGVGQ